MAALRPSWLLGDVGVMDTEGGWEPRNRLPESGLEGTWRDI